MPTNKFVFPNDEVLKRMNPKELDDLTTHALGISADENNGNEIPAGLLRPDHAETFSQSVEQVIIGLRAHLNDSEK